MKKLIIAILLGCILLAGCARHPLDFLKDPDYVNSDSSDTASSDDLSEPDKATSDSGEDPSQGVSSLKENSDNKYDLDTFEIKISDLTAKIYSTVPSELYDDQVKQLSALNRELESIKNDLESCSDTIYADYKRGAITYYEYQSFYYTVTDMENTLNDLEEVLDFKFDVNLS